MKAIVQQTYGSSDVLQFADVDKPTIKDDEVLVRVRAASINHGDWAMTTGRPYFQRVICGLRRPRMSVRGRDVAGHVEAIGQDVAQFRPGDEVYAEITTGSFAEYATVPEALLGLKPTNLTFEQAAAVPLAATTALQGLRDIGKLQPGQKVLINGASGGVGTFAVQIAKALGADVTGVCSTRNVELVGSIVADQVIDYTREDFTRNGQRYDVIFDVAGSRSLSDCRRALTPEGTLVLSSANGGGRVLGPLGRFSMALALSPFVSHRLRVHAARGSREDLGALKKLCESGEVIPAIDRTYPLSDVSEAMRYFGEGHARAKVVITV